MLTPDPQDSPSPVHRWGLSAGLIGVLAVAALLLGTTLWTPGSEAARGDPASAAVESANHSMPASLRQVTVTPAPATSTASPGSVSGEVGGAAVLTELPPVPLAEEVAPVRGVVFSIDGIETNSTDAYAAGSTELRFTLTVRNDTDTPVSLRAASVQLYTGSAPDTASSVSEQSAFSLPETVSAGAAGSGVFVFTVDTDPRDQIRIVVGYAPGIPGVVFEGAAPR